MRPITAVRVAYPRYFELPEYNIHGPDYLTADMELYPFNYSDFLPIGFIPQVRHTYGYTLGNSRNTAAFGVNLLPLTTDYYRCIWYHEREAGEYW